MRRLLMILVLIGVWNYSNGQSSYFPVKKGETWTYAYGAEIYGGTPYEHYINKVRILDVTETIDGKEYFVSETSVFNKEVNQLVITSYFRFGDDGSLISKVDKNEKETITMKKAPKVGDTYASQQGGVTKVLDLNATIKTPTSTYTNCLMIETNENETVSRTYFQQDVGMIATTIIADGSEKFFIYLVSK